MARGVKASRAWIVGSPQYYVYNELAEPKTSDSFALAKMPWPSDHKGVLVDFTTLGKSPQTKKN